MGFPPKEETVSAMRESSVATKMSERRDESLQRSQTCWIRGFPAMMWRGFPGKRDEPQRAGRMPMI